MRPWWRLRARTMACVSAVLVVAVAAHGLVEQAMAQQARTELHRRGNDLAMVGSLATARLFASLEGARDALALVGTEHPAFDAATRPLRDRGLLANAALLDADTFEVLDSVGGPLHLTTRLRSAERAQLRRGAIQGMVVPTGPIPADGDMWLGYAAGPAIPGTGRLFYAEMPVSHYAALFTNSESLERLQETLRTVEVVLYAGAPNGSPALFGDPARLAGLPLVITQRAQFAGMPWTMRLGDRSAPTPFERRGPDALLLGGALLALALGFFVELAARRRTALTVSEQRHRLLLQHASDVVLQLDATLRVVRESESASTVFGYPPGALVGAPLEQVLHAEDAVGALGVVLAHLGSRAPFELSVRLLDAGGTSRHVEVTGTSLLDEPAVRAVVLNIRDVTERRVAEEATARLASIVEATSDMVATILPDGRLLDLNDAGRVMLGIGPEEPVAGRNVADTISGEDADHVLTEAASRAARDRTWSGELGLRTFADTDLPTLGVVVAHHDDHGDVEYFSAVLRDISDRKSLEQQLAHQAFHDGLTGLANRALLLDRLAHALTRAGRRQHRNAVLLVDLDDFKTVNDSLGHLSGDALIVEVALRLRAAARADDTVARLGGDEFAIVLEDVEHDDAAALAERVLEQLRRPIVLAEREVFTSASVGVALSDEETVDAEHLLRDADLALYRVKETGKDGYAVFESAMRSSAVARLALRRDLARAVERHEFVLHYQPIVDLASGSVTGLEALVRWEHPEQGTVSPLDFIPLAEETGAIVGLGRWVLSEAVHQLADWQQRHPELPALYVSVNVSGRQLVEEGFVGDVVAALGAARLRPDQLVLEITESVLVQRVQALAGQLDALRAVGVRVAIDDFGTGYSSLSALDHLPVDILKIDKAFVDGVSDSVSEAAIVTAITRLSAAMGLDIVAEGIEREEQRSGLLKLACPHGQGYLFARPLPAEEALAALLGSTAVQRSSTTS